MKIDKKILVEAHKHCSNHRKEISISKLCGCFYCLNIFKPSEICDWIKEKSNNEIDIEDVGETALCPKCGIDSVMGSKSGFPINDKKFLKEMHKYWFERTVTL